MDTETLFSRITQQFEAGLPFVIYRKPGEAVITTFLQKEKKLYQTRDFTGTGFVFAPFDNRKAAVIIPEEASEKIISEAPHDQIPVQKDSGKTVSENSPEEKAYHLALVEKGLSELRSGNLQKVVLSRREEVELPEMEPVKMLQELLRFYPTAFVYLWFHPETGLWLGATPEILLKVAGNRFQTMALAGTQPYEGSMEVEWSEKEIQEQRFVTDEILSQLRSSVSEMRTSDVHTAQAGNLLHLRTDIQGQLPTPDSRIPGPNRDLKELIRALHPTPAVCGLPREQAKRFILKEEPYDREFYTGFLGELNTHQVTQRSRSRRNVENLAYRAVKKETNLYVNLRCMKIEGGKALLYVGGGITRDSDAKAEWQETVNKAGTMKKVLMR